MLASSVDWLIDATTLLHAPALVSLPEPLIEEVAA
jgi:hypothetical protein